MLEIIRMENELVNSKANKLTKETQKCPNNDLNFQNLQMQ